MKFPRHQFKKAWEHQADLNAKKISSVELTTEYLARIKNDKTNSYITVTGEQALAAAKLQDAARAKGQVASALAGIPVGIKDIFTTKGILTTCASKILSNYIPPYDASVVQKLSASGAVSLGKLNMDEFAMGSANENSAYGGVALPQDPTRVPGGSSGGSAAAVAGNLAVATLGTDTGGSVRQPASFCGVVGLKPTYGRVSRYGIIAFASSLDQAGPVALDAQDCADLLEVMSGYDELDSTSSSDAVPHYGASVRKIRTDATARSAFLKGLRIGVPKEFFPQGLDGKVKSSIENAIETLKNAGATIVPVSLPHSEYALAVYYVVAVSEASANLARYDGVRFGPRIMPHGQQTSLDEMYEATRGQLFGAEVKRRILLGTFTLSSGYYDAYYKKACQVRRLIAEDFSKCFKSCDVIVGPTTPTVSFPRGHKTTDPITMYLNDIFTVPVNLAGIPALSMPWGTGEAGLPIGLQFIGNHMQDGKLLELAAAMEVLQDQQMGIN